MPTAFTEWWQIDMLTIALGLAIGSFINVLALRSLSNHSIFSPRSRCPRCKHQLAILDLIPLFSYMLLGGKCRYCKEKVSIQYPLVEATTAILFLLVVHKFGVTPEGIGMLCFVSTLIAVTVTDFLAKLIPHEITYPAILVGLIYTACLSPKHDLTSAMVGVGLSYILFDFLAFYGLKVYLWAHGGQVPEHVLRDMESEQNDLKLLIANQEAEREADDPYPDPEVDETFGIVVADSSKNRFAVEDFEVMGGGDAVLSALISAWIGWDRLIFALLIGFFAGAIMGACYLVNEMRQEKLLSRLIRPCSIGIVVSIVFIGLFLHFLTRLTTEPIPAQTWVGGGCVAILLGGMLGVIFSGLKVSKQFPFGPALAFGAVVATLASPVSPTGTPRQGGA